jgi:serine/threonine protein kinase
MSPLPRIGSQIGNYQLVDFIDAGGMGAVYLAQHLYLDRQVAFKVLSDDLSEDEDFHAKLPPTARHWPSTPRSEPWPSRTASSGSWAACCRGSSN